MAVKKGTSVGVKAGMKDQTSSNVARDGAAKRPQTSFDVHSAMKDQTSYSANPNAKGTGPVANGPDPMDPTVPGKTFAPAGPKWGMRDANGQSVNHELGRRVLSEGALTGR